MSLLLFGYSVYIIRETSLKNNAHLVKRSIVSQQLDITKFSVPEAVEKGKDTELICEHDNPEQSSIVKWFWIPDGADSKTQFYQRAFGGAVKFIIPRNEPFPNITLVEEDKHNLALWDLQPEHSGTFQCQVEEAKGDFLERRIASDLVVYSIGVGPQLTFQDVDDEVQVVCEASEVAPAPEITISYDSATFITTVLEGPVDGLYNVSTNATLSRQDVEGKEISCKLSFADTDFVTAEATETYHSSAWPTSSEAPAPATAEAPAALETDQASPGSAGRADAAWALAALATFLHLRL